MTETSPRAPPTIPHDPSRSSTGSGAVSAPSATEDKVPVYTVLLSKGDKNKYGVAYRVVTNLGVVVTGVIPSSPADDWNTTCDPNNTICAGDVIGEANGQTAARAIVDELLNSVQLVVHAQKTGPRWHITGEGALPKEMPSAQSGMLGSSGTSKTLGSHQGSSARVAEEDESEAEGKNEPLQICHWFLIFAAVFVPNLILIGLFSDVGAGIKTFTALAKPDRNMQGNALVFVGSMGAVGLVIYDWTKWTSKLKKFGYAIVVLYMMCIGFTLKSRYYPFAPLVILVFHVPVFLGVLRGKILHKVQRKSFYVGVTTSALLCAFFILAMWLCWMNIESWDGANQWGDATKERLVMDSKEMYDDWSLEINGTKRSLNYFWDCSPELKQGYDYGTINAFKYNTANYTFSTYKMSNKDNQNRGNGCSRLKTIWFLTYTTPMMCTGICLIIGVFCLLNGVLLNVTDTSKLEKVLKQFILMICFLVFTMYVSSSVAGASMRLTGVIMAFCASGMFALCVWLYMEIGRKAITSQVRGSKLMQSLIVLATSDWVRACVLIGANVLIPTFIVINMLNQWVRKKRGLVSREEPRYTAGAFRVIMAVQNWNWASILIKANWLVILYWTFSVGVAKITYVFLSWLNQLLLTVPFVIVLIVFFFIGFTMFMLPPVPGIPVYITAGIVLSARARDIPQVGGFWGGMCIGILESLILKICAVCGQYCIGFFLGKSVKVQQMVAVDKVFTRSIEMILNTRGMNLPKVSVLVGGPDWPTSVLCGILRLHLGSVCFGTLPVIFVSAPCVVAGAFLSNPGLKSDDARRLGSQTTPPPIKKEEDIWQTMSTLALGVSMMMQLAGMILALYNIQETVHNHGEELGQPRREHEAVAALTRREADYVQEYNNAISWPTLLKSRKYLIVASTISMLLSTFMFVMMDEACFRTFQVSSKISDPFDKEGLEGDIMNLVLPLGWFATACFFGACALHFAFLKWAGAEAKKRLVTLLESRPPPLEDDEGAM